MINVCYIVDAPYVGGAEQYIRRLALGLDPTAFCPSLVVRSGSEEVEAWAQAMRDDGVPATSVPMSLPFAPGHASGIVRAIGATSPHIVHVNMPGPYDGQMGLACPLARMAGAVAVVTTEHLPMVERLWKRAMVKGFGYRFVDRVLTVCEANVAHLVGRQHVDPRRVVVVPNGVREDFGIIEVDRAAVLGAHGLGAEKPTVAFVGSIEQRKGLDRAISELSRIEAPWQLVVVGDGPDRADCERLGDVLGVRERVRFTGWVRDDMVEAILVAADLLVLPSSVEGMPYVILEAMAARTPVVATRVAGIPEVVVDGETGLLVDDGDGDGLRAALRALIGDGVTRSRMAMAGRKRFEDRFTLRRQIEAISSLYRSLVGG